ncbi:MAG: helix-turn-helix transcriptional regulator [Actinomycetota bacterium]
MLRIERVINLIIALLEAPRPLTAEDIRARVGGYDRSSHEAFRRTFERDKETLRAMGIPLELRPSDPFSDQADAYTIPKSSYYLPDLDLEPDEVAALRIAADALLGAGDAAGSAFLKLATDDPIGPVAGPRIVWGADLAAEEPLLAPIHAALLERRPVRFDYPSAAGDTASRTLHPYGLVHRKGRWYVVGLDPARSDIRSFRLSRIAGDLETLDGGYEIPTGFDAAAQLAGEAWEVGRPGDDQPDTARVRFEPHMRWWPEQNLPDAPRREASGGAVEVELPVANLDALISWALGFGSDVEIVAPETARARMVEHLRPHLPAGRG